MLNRIYYDTGYWYAEGYDGITVYHVQNITGLPPQSGWSVVSGVGPAPEVYSGECTSHVAYCVVNAGDANANGTHRYVGILNGFPYYEGLDWVSSSSSSSESSSSDSISSSSSDSLSSSSDSVSSSDSSSNSSSSESISSSSSESISSSSESVSNSSSNSLSSSSESISSSDSSSNSSSSESISSSSSESISSSNSSESVSSSSSFSSSSNSVSSSSSSNTSPPVMGCYTPAEVPCHGGTQGTCGDGFNCQPGGTMIFPYVFNCTAAREYMSAHPEITAQSCCVGTLCNGGELFLINDGGPITYSTCCCFHI